MIKKLITLSAALFVCVFAGNVYAETPANTLLTNAATLDFTGNGDPIEAEATVTVLLRATAVSITALDTEPANVSQVQGSAYAGTYVIQSNANGQDTYTISFAALVTNGNVENHDTSLNANPFGTSAGAISLGATAAAAVTAGTSATITVPADGVGGGANFPINGIDDGETVIIKGLKFTVDSTFANTTGTSTITLTQTLTAGGIAGGLVLGDGIYEYTEFDVELDSVGNPIGAGAASITYTVSVESVDDGTKIYNNTVIISVVAIDFEKYVRNITVPVTGGGGTVSFNSDGSAGNEDFYKTGVTAKPEDTLEYLLVITTPSDGGITAPLLTDLLPDFSSYVALSTQTLVVGGTIAAIADKTSPTFPLDGPTHGGQTLTDIAASKTVYVVYKVSLSTL